MIRIIFIIERYILLSMTIKIPEKFKAKLDGEYDAYINNMLVTYNSIYDDNKVEFFAEYTNHGSKHVEEVLNAAANLITEESYNFLNTKDIFVLIVAVLLHDVGMHISSEGAKKIFSDDYDRHRINLLDSKSWKQVWTDFLYEAKRFNENELEDIFGTSNVDIGNPDLDDLSDLDRKLFGEFFRRYHPRLAHEIAKYGFPTKLGTDNIIIPSSAIDDEIIDICGLVARSHGMNLRDTFDYMNELHDDSWKNPFDIKVFFLMVILRISDYIQIHAERASSVLVQTKRFASPISTQEWIKHGSIKDININTSDPEKIFVKAKPENSKIFLELKKLFKDIQYELDISWAILGEVYGRDERLNSLKIKYRRITSNIDDINKFSRGVNYIPEKIRFDADPELLKLLIGPLYGEDPKYGIRELLQNSVDAVKEREFVEDDYNSKIIVSIDKQEESNDLYILSVQDNGIGMTKETIVNYFFRAGASFRNSMVWKKSFVEDSEVKIEKTGRFGVGVLAAFLLGEEFELYTRHFKDKKGYYCKASLSTKQVELLKEDCDIGTLIKIKLNEKILKNFSSLIKYFKEKNRHRSFYEDDETKLTWFKWYVMDSPKIEYRIENQDLANIFEYNKILVSSKPDKPLDGWYHFSTPEFKSVHWTVSDKETEYYLDDYIDQELFCNGFRILRSYQMPNFPWQSPTVSVFDGNAKMPLSLSRDYLLNDRLPFENKLISNFCSKIIEVLNEVEFEKCGNYWLAKDKYIDFLKGRINISEYVVVSNDKYTLITPFIFDSLNIEIFYQVWLSSDSNKNSLFKDVDTFYSAKYRKNDQNYFYKRLLEGSYFEESVSNRWFNVGSYRTRGDLAINDYILNDKLSYMCEKNRLSKSFRDSYKNRSQLFNERWTVIGGQKDLENEYLIISDDQTGKKKRVKKPKRVLPESQINIKNLTNEYYYYVKEYFINMENLQPFEPFKKEWERLIGENEFLIPIKKEYRRKIDIGHKSN
jgi:hypothetical protein